MAKSKKKKNSNSSSKKQKQASIEVDKPTQAPKLHAFWNDKILQCVTLFIVSVGIYANTFFHKYAVDDSIVILQNKFTKKGLAGLSGIFGEDTFTGFFGSKRNLVEGGRYRPLSLATFALELQLFGSVRKDKNGNPILDEDGDVTYNGSPFVSHLVNAILYGILCVFIFLMLLAMFQSKWKDEPLKVVLISFSATLLYALHPIHTEAVANIKGRDEIMVFLGAIMATYWTLKSFEVTVKWNYILGASLAFFMSIFSKENAITFIAIIPAALYVFKSASIKDSLKYTLPFLLIFGLFWFGIRSTVLGDAASVSSTAPAKELMNNPFLKVSTETGYVDFTASEKYGTVLYTWLKYIKLLIYPHPLTNDYYPKYIRTSTDDIPTLQDSDVLLSLLFHLACFGLMIIGVLKRRTDAFFVLFYFATFSVVSNLLFPIGTNMAERFMFLPSLAFTCLITMLLYHLLDRRIKGGLSINPRLFLVTILAISSLYAIKTFSRNSDWYNDYTLFMADIHTSSESAKMNNAASGALQDELIKQKDLSTVTRREMLNRAHIYSKKATELHPYYNNAWLLHGNANVKLGQLCLEEATSIGNESQGAKYQEALQYFNNGLMCYDNVAKLRPDHPDIKQNYQVTYREKGKLLGQRMGRMSESITALEKSLQYNDKDTETLRLLGVASGISGMQYQSRGMMAESAQQNKLAIEYFQRALDVNPSNVPILYNLEVAYRVTGQTQKALEINARWKEINPDYNPQNNSNQ